MNVVGTLMTTDPSLTSAISQVTDYFGDNIAYLIGAVIGISLLLWFLRLFLRGVGVGKAKVG